MGRENAGRENVGRGNDATSCTTIQNYHFCCVHPRK